MITNTDCTAYCYNKATKAYDRHYIPAVMWQEQRTQKASKQGIIISDGITIYIPKENATEVKFEGTKDILVKGCCEFEFDNSNQQSISDSLKQFRIEYPSFVVVNTVAEKTYSFNKSLSHIKVIAR